MIVNGVGGGNDTDSPVVGTDSSLIKVAVQMVHQEGLLTVFDQRKSLQCNIGHFLMSWSINESPDQFVLLYDGSDRLMVTDKNRCEIKDGTMLRVVPSPRRTICDLLQQIRESQTETGKELYEQLATLCHQSSFAVEFCSQGGMQLLIENIESCDLNDDDWLAAALEIFDDLTNQSLFDWDRLTRRFVEKIVSLVHTGSSIQRRQVLIAAMIVMEDILVSGCDWAVRVVDEQLPLPNLLLHLQSQTGYCDAAIQHNCVALVNALFAKADANRRTAIVRTLLSKQFRTLLLNSIIQRTNVTLNAAIGSPNHMNNTLPKTDNQDNTIGCEMAHQLYVLQSNMLSIYYERTRQFDEAEVLEKCSQLVRQAFDQEFNFGGGDIRSRVKSTYSVSLQSDEPTSYTHRPDEITDNYVKLGFTHPVNPARDFMDDPKMLSLDFMLYFALNYTDNYIKVVFENCSRAEKEYECPFVRSSIEITRLLVKLLKLGESPRDEGQQYHVMFFTHDFPLEELFSICVPLLNKTWKEMRATVEDFTKVFSVLQQQLIEAFRCKEDTATFEQLRKRLSSLTYSEILNIWQRERNSREEWENNAASILELRATITPNMLEVVKQHRIQFLTDGTRFVKYSNKGQRLKDKYWFCRLSNKSKVLFYGDCEDDQIPSIEHLPHKLPIIDIRSMVIGRDCPHMKDAKSKKSTFQLAFSLLTESEELPSLNFVAPDERTYHLWTDGLNALLGNRMTSGEVDVHLEMLLGMEMKLKLLETEGYKIPDVSPEIPPPVPLLDLSGMSS